MTDSVKFSTLTVNDKGHIWVNIKQPYENELWCQIIDDGVGLKNSTVQLEKNAHISKGIQITKERLGTKGKIHINNQPDKTGVVVNIHLSIVET